MHRESTLRQRYLDLAERVAVRLPLPELRRPIFIVGCGRSGTTILGKSLSQHRDIAYLNEPHRMWSKLLSHYGCLERKRKIKRGKIRLDGSAVDVESAIRFRRRLYLETVRQRANTLVEKLPINSFRIPFLCSLAPDARFISLHRNAVEVARSIATFGPAWWGVGQAKWVLLAELASANPATSDLPRLCASDLIVDSWSGDSQMISLRVISVRFAHGTYSLSSTTPSWTTRAKQWLHCSSSLHSTLEQKCRALSPARFGVDHEGERSPAHIVATPYLGAKFVACRMKTDRRL